jgi:hypothetical protein
MSTLIIKPMDQEAEKRPKLKRGKQMAACSEKVCENHTQNIVGPDMTPDILKGG